MIKVLLGAAALLLCMTRPALSQEIHIPGELCGTPDAVHALLQGRYHEELLGAGPEKNGAYVEVWGQPDGATWTVVVYPKANDGKLACFLLVGTDWSVPMGKPI